MVFSTALSMACLDACCVGVNKKTIAHVELASAVLTFVGICVFYGFWVDGSVDVQMPVWSTGVAFVNLTQTPNPLSKWCEDALLPTDSCSSPNRQDCVGGLCAVRQFDASIQALELDFAQCQRDFALFKYYGGFNFTVVPVLAGKVYVDWTIFAVLLISFLFQGGRALIILKMNNNDKLGATDLSRWIEYFLTSPLQIMVVAITYGFGEWDSLFMLALLQAILIVFGAVIEIGIAQVVETRDHITKKQIGVLTMVAWIIHISIWTVIYFKNETNDSLSECTQTTRQEVEGLSSDEMGGAPDAILFIYLSQVITFSAFGLWQLVILIQAFSLQETSETMNDNYQSLRQSPLPTLSEDNAATFSEVAYKGSDHRHKIQSSQALGYSILSVTAKLLLEISFITYARLEPFKSSP